jgi:undecaprenyl-diphosphatase
MHFIITVIAKYFIILPILISAAWLLYAKSKGRLRYVVVLILGGIIAVLLTKLGTTFIHDPRPFIVNGVVPYFQSSTDNGFPSDHTVFATVFAAAMWPFNKYLSGVMYGITLLIGVSRVIAGVHHGWDIVGGLVIGTIAVAAAYWFLELVWRPKTTHKTTKTAQPKG